MKNKSNKTKPEQRDSAITPWGQRMHMGLTVADLDASTFFYQTLLGMDPSKRREGYVKFSSVEPSLNLSLNQVRDGHRVEPNPGAHYGIEVRSSSAVESAIQRLSEAGLSTTIEKETTCCYAVQDKVWAVDPDGNPWEVFVVREDAGQRVDDQSSCCGSSENEPASCCA